MNLLGCPFCAKCKENKFQSTGARKTARKTRAETAPATCRNKSKKHRFWPPKWLQNPYKIAPRGLSEAAGAPRRTQDAAKSSKPRPKRPQERAKSAPRAPGCDFHDFPCPGGGPNFEAPGGGRATLAAGFWRGRPPGTAFSRGECVDFLVFRGSSKKWPPLKLKQSFS